MVPLSLIGQSSIYYDCVNLLVQRQWGRHIEEFLAWEMFSRIRCFYCLTWEKHCFWPKKYRWMFLAALPTNFIEVQYSVRYIECLTYSYLKIRNASLCTECIAASCCLRIMPRKTQSATTMTFLSHTLHHSGLSVAQYQKVQVLGLFNTLFSGYHATYF